MSRAAKDFIDRFGRRVLTDGGQPGRDGVEGVGSTTEELQGRVAAALLATGGHLNDVQLDEIIGWVAAYKTQPSTWMLYEHDDGRYAVARDGAATFTVDAPEWHRVHSVEVHGLLEPAGAEPARFSFRGQVPIARTTRPINKLSHKEQAALEVIQRANAARQIAREQLVEARDACLEADFGSEVRGGLDDAARALDEAKGSLDYVVKTIAE